MKFTIRDEAGDEAAYHVAWFRARNRQAGDRLSKLFVETIREIARRPARFPLLEYPDNPGNIRRARLKKFPLVIIYQLFDDEIDVLAVAHTSQDYDYWLTRLRN
jgi:plasmid stabilization system protein ParE